MRDDFIQLLSKLARPLTGTLLNIKSCRAFKRRPIVPPTELARGAPPDADGFVQELATDLREHGFAGTRALPDRRSVSNLIAKPSQPMAFPANRTRANKRQMMGNYIPLGLIRKPPFSELKPADI